MGRLFLALLPFVLIALIYVVASAERRATNPNDKLLPPVSEMVDAVRRLAFERDGRSGQVLLGADTAASLRRLAIGLTIALSVLVLAALSLVLFGEKIGLAVATKIGLGAAFTIRSRSSRSRSGR